MSGNGDGTFQIGLSFPFSFSFVVGDFNGDGRSDIVGASSTNTLALLLGSADGTFQPAITINASPAHLLPQTLMVTASSTWRCYARTA